MTSAAPKKSRIIRILLRRCGSSVWTEPAPANVKRKQEDAEDAEENRFFFVACQSLILLFPLSFCFLCGPPRPPFLLSGFRGLESAGHERLPVLQDHRRPDPCQESLRRRQGPGF